MELEAKVFDDLAIEFMECKKDTIRGILKMGKVFRIAKDKMEHGMFIQWLNDERVSMSLRNCQRFMVIYDNFFHLLDSPKIETISQIEFTKLLELKNLPQRFKKTVEIEHDGAKESVDVVDEDKLVSFLNKTTVVDNQIKVVKDLPVKQLRQQIIDVGGEYKDLRKKDETGISDEIGEDDPNPIAIETKPKKSGYDEFIQMNEIIVPNLIAMVNKVESISDVTIFEMGEDDKARVKSELIKLKDICLAVVVKVNEKECKL